MGRHGVRGPLLSSARHLCLCTMSLYSQNEGRRCQDLEQLAVWKAGLEPGVSSWCPGCPSSWTVRLRDPWQAFYYLPGLSGARLPPGLQLLSLTFGISVLSGQMPTAASCPDLSSPLQADRHGQIWASPRFQDMGGMQKKEGTTVATCPCLTDPS